MVDSKLSSSHVKSKTKIYRTLDEENIPLSFRPCNIKPIGLNNRWIHINRADNGEKSVDDVASFYTKYKLPISSRVVCPKDRNNHKQFSSSRWISPIHPSIHVTNTQMDEEIAQRMMKKTTHLIWPPFLNSNRAPYRTRVMCRKHDTRSMNNLVKRMDTMSSPSIHPSIQRMDEWKEEVAKDEKRKSMTWLLYSNPSNQSGAAPTPSYRLRVKCRHFLAQATHKHQQSTDNPGRIDEQNVRTIHPCSTGMDEGNVRRMKREMHPASQLWSSGEGSEGRVKDGALEAEGKWVKL